VLFFGAIAPVSVGVKVCQGCDNYVFGREVFVRDFLILSATQADRDLSPRSSSSLPHRTGVRLMLDVFTVRPLPEPRGRPAPSRFPPRFMLPIGRLVSRSLSRAFLEPADCASFCFEVLGAGEGHCCECAVSVLENAAS
jgi:hypothetical protein